ARLARCPRPREGPVTQPTAGGQPWRRERVLMPRTCRSRYPPGSALLGGERSFAATPWERRGPPTPVVRIPPRFAPIRKYRQWGSPQAAERTIPCLPLPLPVFAFNATCASCRQHRWRPPLMTFLQESLHQPYKQDRAWRQLWEGWDERA